MILSETHDLSKRGMDILLGDLITLMLILHLLCRLMLRVADQQDVSFRQDVSLKFRVNKQTVRSDFKQMHRGVIVRSFVKDYDLDGRLVGFFEYVLKGKQIISLG